MVVSPDSKRPFRKIVIVGAGPAGLLLAIMLTRHHIPVLVLEAWPQLDSRLRATQYGTPATRIFRKAGVLDDIRAVAMENFPSICWRKVSDGKEVARVDLSLTKDDPDRITVMQLGEMLKILYRHCQDLRVDVRFEHRVVKVGQDGDKAWVDVNVGNGDERGQQIERLDADYVVGCDGASSRVRQDLFGKNWPGITWPYVLLVQNVFYDGFKEHGWSGGNYMMSKDHWGLIAERAKGGLWRVTYGDVGGFDHDEYLKRREWHFEAMLPGHPKPGEYRVTETNQFKIHNRCVASMRVSRVLLAADAAHVCNPFGGYGAMGGIVDAGALADCFIGYYDGRAGEDILDLYATIRREKYLAYVDRRSIMNMNRLSQLDPDRALEEDKFLRLLAENEKDPEKAKAFLLVSQI